MNNDVVIEKIKKLLALSKDGAAHEGEVLNALASARRLMEKFGIDEQSVLLTESDDAVYGRIVKEELFSRAFRNMPRFYCTTAQAAAEICDCRVYVFSSGQLISGRVRPKVGLWVYGIKEDVQICRQLFADLLTMMHTLARIRTGQSWSGSSSRSYMIGFSLELWNRASVEKNKGKLDHGQIGALVLRKDIMVRKWADDNLGLKEAKKMRATKITDPSAYAAGRLDGRNADMSVRKNEPGTRKGAPLLT